MMEDRIREGFRRTGVVVGGSCVFIYSVFICFGIVDTITTKDTSPIWTSVAVIVVLIALLPVVYFVPSRLIQLVGWVICGFVIKNEKSPVIKEQVRDTTSQKQVEGISLKEHLANLGWDDSYLSDDGLSAHIITHKLESCYESFTKRKGQLRKYLPLREVFCPGMRINFLKSLTGLTYSTAVTDPTSGFLGRLYMKSALYLMTFWDHETKKEFLKRPMFESYLEEPLPVDVSEFPYDEFLTIECRERYRMICSDSEGRRWCINHVPLQEVTQIYIQQPLETYEQWIEDRVAERLDSMTEQTT